MNAGQEGIIPHPARKVYWNRDIYFYTSSLPNPDSLQPKVVSYDLSVGDTLSLPTAMVVVKNLGPIEAPDVDLQGFDLIAAAERVVTINSAVGIEAYLHRKPVVLCGRGDFHHVADVAQNAEALRKTLGRPARRRTYDKLIWWYLGDQCLDVGAGSGGAVFAPAVGFSPTALAGLAPCSGPSPWRLSHRLALHPATHG